MILTNKTKNFILVAAFAGSLALGTQHTHASSWDMLPTFLMHPITSIKMSALVQKFLDTNDKSTLPFFFGRLASYIKHDKGFFKGFMKPEIANKDKILDDAQESLLSLTKDKCTVPFIAVNLYGKYGDKFQMPAKGSGDNGLFSQLKHAFFYRLTLTQNS